MRGSLLAAAGIGALLCAGGASADTLRDALVRTYQSNPTLTGQRAQVRGLDEGVALARAAGRPQLSATGGLNQDLTRTGGGTGRNLSAQLNVSYPLFNAGSVRNRIRGAEERVIGGRATLRATEGDVFTEAVGAYMDVIRDRSIVTLDKNQVKVLETNLQASKDRFEVGDLTRTDVAQSEARLSLARSTLATAEGTLTSSEENYRRIIGTMPDELQPPPPLPPLPATADQAVDTALANNSDLAAIAAQARAAGLDVAVARAGRLPTLSAIGTGSYTNYLGTANEQFGITPIPGVPGTSIANTQTTTSIGVQATIPIYQGGRVGAEVRQSQATESQLIEQQVATERQVIANARAAFASYQASLDAIKSNEVAVAANTLALEGVRAEQTVGTRTILDVLNAEQELLNSQVALVSARRDAYVAGFNLVNAMGRANIQDLNLDGGYIYDPIANYRRVAGRANDWAEDPTPTAQATRTIAGPPAPATLPLARTPGEAARTVAGPPVPGGVQMPASTAPQPQNTPVTTPQQ